MPQALHDNTNAAMQALHEHRHINQVQKKPQNLRQLFCIGKLIELHLSLLSFPTSLGLAKYVLMVTTMGDHTLLHYYLLLLVPLALPINIRLSDTSPDVVFDREPH